jgi:hypothetical protein
VDAMITPRPERAPLLARRNAAITDPSKHIASRLWLNEEMSGEA